MKKRKIVSVFLALVIMLLNIPASAFSAASEMAESYNASGNRANSTTDDEIFILEEDTSKRGQFEKHYLCSDGSFISVTYSEPVHYLGNNNQWEDIDLSPKSDLGMSQVGTRNESFGYAFAEKASATNIAEMNFGSYTLSWGISLNTEENDDANIHSGNTVGTAVSAVSDSTIQIKNNPVKQSSTADKKYISDKNTFILPNTSSKFEYTSGNGISLEYTVYQNKIEEDILIEKEWNAESVCMNMDIGNLMPTVNKDGSVFLVDEAGTTVFIIGAPYLVDAAFSVCNDISVLAEKSGTRCIITYTPDKKWMNSSERVYPIILDPSVTTSDYVSNIEDTYVEENSSVNHSTEQYLYINRNGNKKRNTIVRINQLPIVDESMPIISAYLVLTAQSSSTDFIDMKACYLDTALDMVDYTYALSERSYNSFIEYSYLEDGYSYVEFDVSSHIYEMYEDAKWDEENGYDYHGDFVIGLEYSTDTSYVPPFYSSEYTGVASRPKLIVRYGYSLPAGIMNNSVYSFMNCGSACYMSVNGTNPSNNSNIYQILGNGDGAELYQKFKLEYVSSTGGYLLRSMASSSGTDKVVSINRGSAGVSGNMNIRLSSSGDSIGQEWLIVPVDYYEFKIVPRSNMSLAITAYGYNNGSNTGTSYNSAGNIFVKEYDGDNLNQRWFIDDADGNAICTNVSRSSMETDTYYITNYYSGMYFHRNNNNVNCARNKIAVLGENTVQWKIVNLGDGYCTIQRSDLPGFYVAQDGDGVKVIYRSTDSIDDKCRWNISLSNGTYLIKNKNGKYLTYNSSNSTVSLSNLSSSGTDSYKKQLWRFMEDDYYVELTNFSIPNMIIEVGEYDTPSMTKSPSNATWGSLNDFLFTIQNEAGYNGGANVVNGNCMYGLSKGRTKVTATHKVTGVTKEFYLDVCTRAIILLPGMMGSAIYSNPFSITYNNAIYTFGLDDYLWDPADLLNFSRTRASILALACDSNGDLLYPTQVNAPIVNNNKYSYRKYGARNIYENIYLRLCNEFSESYDVILYEYDWRFDPYDTAIELRDYIEDNFYSGIVFVSHSMGGNVSSYYLALGEEERNRVDKHISVATPYLGAEKIAYVFDTGDALDIFADLDSLIIGSQIKSIMPNIQSIYSLLPMEIGFTSYLQTENSVGVVTTQNTFSSTINTLSSKMDGWNNNLYNSSKSHQSLLFVNNEHVTQLVDSYYIVGDGESTPQMLRMKLNATNQKVDNLTINNYTTEGDGTVSLHSSLIDGIITSHILVKYGNLEVDAGHVELIEGNDNQKTFDYICDVIKGINVYSFNDSTFFNKYSGYKGIQR